MFFNIVYLSINSWTQFSSNAREFIWLPIVVLDELVALIVSVLTLTLRLRYRKITLMQLHTVVVLGVHIVLANIRLWSLRWILWSLPVVGTVLMGSRSRSRHLRPVHRRVVRNLVLSRSVFVGVGTWTRWLPLVLWIVIRGTSIVVSTLRWPPVSSVSLLLLMLLERVLIATHCGSILGLLPTDKRAVGKSSSLIHILFGRDLRSVVCEARWSISFLSLVYRFIMVISIKKFLNAWSFQLGLVLLHLFWIRVFPFAIRIFRIEIVFWLRWYEWSL